MKPIEPSEILPLGAYEAIRDPFRSRVILEKKLRRVALGSKMTALFENRDTVLLQIQEMLRTERITRPSAIHHEIETYNQLLPGPRELSATILIEIDEREERERMLVALSGIERHISLAIGSHRFPATWESERILEGRASAVLYLKFPISSEAIALLRGGTGPVELVADHPSYAERVVLSPALVQSLAEDFDN